MELADHGPAEWHTIAGSALLLLGRLPDPETGAFLRARAEEGEDLAAWALARRGDPGMLERLRGEARDGEEFALALLMEADPAGARTLLEEALLGPDDRAAHRMLEGLGEFAPPGAWYEALGFDWRRTPLGGFDRAALAARVPPVRLARIAITLPGCRTRALGAAAARGLRPGDLVEDRERDLGGALLDEIGAFLESAAPEDLVASLRRIRAAGKEDAALATEWLEDLGDAGTCAAAAADLTLDGDRIEVLARSRAPEVGRMLETRVRTALEQGWDRSESNCTLAALAVFHGLPGEAADAFRHRQDPAPRDSVEAVLAGKPVDGLAAILAAEPDRRHGNVGAVDDPRVRAYLHRLRERRDLGEYWYATGQLAVLGDAAARADFWGAMEDGRYRIMDEAEEFERTLGWDLPATMPFWIGELRSQCCRMVTSGAGDLVEDLLGTEANFDSPFRTPWRRAKEQWDAAGGRFVRSRIAEDGLCPRFVPDPR
jgi:hypothetical protein